MIEDEVGHFFDVEPFGVVFVAQLFFVLVDIDQCEIGDTDRSLHGVAGGVSEGFHLFHIHPFEAGESFQDAVSGLFEAFFLLEESAHEAPFASFRF